MERRRTDVLDELANLKRYGVALNHAWFTETLQQLDSKALLQRDESVVSETLEREKGKMTQTEIALELISDLLDLVKGRPRTSNASWDRVYRHTMQQIQGLITADPMAITRGNVDEYTNLLKQADDIYAEMGGTGEDESVPPARAKGDDSEANTTTGGNTQCKEGTINRTRCEAPTPCWDKNTRTCFTQGGTSNRMWGVRQSQLEILERRRADFINQVQRLQRFHPNIGNNPWVRANMQPLDPVALLRKTPDEINNIIDNRSNVISIADDKIKPAITLLAVVQQVQRRQPPVSYTHLTLPTKA